MKSYIIVLLFIQYQMIAMGQEVYYSAIAKLSDPYYRTVIGIFSLNDCTTQELYVDTTIINTGYGEWIDIAICTDENLYAVGHDGIYLIDIVNHDHIKILDEPPYPRWDKGMTCTKDTTLIFGERDILRYDIYDDQLTYLGRIPTPLSVWGNIFHFQGQLFYSANVEVIHLDTSNLLNNQVYCTLAPTSGLLSLTEVAVSCDSTAIFALFTSGDIYLFNPADCSISFYCTLFAGQGENAGFQGSSPNFMYMPPDPCRVSIDLDANNETMSGIDYSDTLLCELPSGFIFSPVDLFSDRAWDSLQVWIDQGPLGVYLNGNSPSFATLTGQETNSLLFTSTNGGLLDEFEHYISTIELNGEMPPGISFLKIGFAAWAGIRRSDTAFAYITLISRQFFSGTGQSIEVCSNAHSILLSELLSYDADPSGIWTPILTQTGRFSPSLDPSGTYYYIVDDPFCGPDTAFFELNTFPEPNTNLGSIVQLCPGDTAVLELNIPNSTFTWSNGLSGSSIQVTAPGRVWVEIHDEYDCFFSDSIDIVLDESCLLDKIFVPNIFSPNGDGLNDEWILAPYPGIESMEVTIFDRWGNALFHQKAESILWNGETFDHQIILPGVYAYSLKLKTPTSNLLKTGDITVIK